MSLVELVDNRYTDKNTVHSYLPLYDELLKSRKDSAKNVIEIGVYAGGSIKLWNDYFTNANVYGVDIENESSPFIANAIGILSGCERVKLHLGTNAYSQNIFGIGFQFDFVIDDGPHTLQSMLDCISLYAPTLTEKGILIIEDVQDISWLNEMINHVPQELAGCVKTFDLRSNKNRWDDIVFVIDKSLL